jgi:hypothetical protein
MPAELLDQPEPVYRFTSGVMQNVQLHKAEEKVTG